MIHISGSLPHRRAVVIFCLVLAGSGSYSADKPQPSNSVPEQVVVSLQAGKLQKKVPRQLWGTAFFNRKDDASWGATVARWGGNASTMYNWVLGAWNEGITSGCANTYYGDSKEGGKLLRGALGKFAEKDVGAEFLLTVPIISWCPKDGSSGRPGWGPGDLWLQNIPFGPDFMAQWLRMLRANGQLPAFISLDNEPDYWGMVHQNVCPREVTTKEITENFLRYGGAIKEAIPEAVLIGPICTSLNTAFSNAEKRDSASRGGLTQTQYFLRRCAEYEKKTGVRVLDYFGFQSYDGAGSLQGTRRLERELRAVNKWIAEEYPGTRIAMTEYSWHIDRGAWANTAECGLAYGLGFGLMMREGLDLATIWTKPGPNTPPAMGFKIYRNYDDNGSCFEGNMVPTVSDMTNVVEAFGAVSPDKNILRVFAINQKPKIAARVTFKIEGFKSKLFERYDYTTNNVKAIVAGQGGVISGSSFSADMLPFSMSMFVISAKPVEKPAGKNREEAAK